MEISNPGWLPPQSVTAAKVADQSLTSLQIQVLGRSVVVLAGQTFTPDYDGDYLIYAVGAGAGAGGAAGNAAGDSSSGGSGGGSGSRSYTRLFLTGGVVYTSSIGAGGAGGAGGADTPTAGSAGADGGATSLLDASGVIIATANGGFGGPGGYMTSGASLQEIAGRMGFGEGGGPPGNYPSSGNVGNPGVGGAGPGAGGGGASGNYAVATASAGAIGGSGEDGYMLITW